MQDFKYAKVSSNTFSKYAELRVCSDELDEAATRTQSDSSNLQLAVSITARDTALTRPVTCHDIFFSDYLTDGKGTAGD